METFDEDQMAKEALQEYLMYHPSYYLELNDWQRKILGLGPRKDRKYSPLKSMPWRMG